MGQGPRQETSALIAVLAAVAAAMTLVLAAPRPAAADPIFELPPNGEGVVAGGDDDCDRSLAFLAEANLLGVLGTDARSTYPEVEGIVGNEPELGTARLGLIGRGSIGAWIVRVDASEAMRVDLDDVEDEPLAAIDRFIDDASVWWTPSVWANVVLGRQKLPFSRFRHADRALVTAGAPPFIVDQIAPDRRWGAAFHGDLGALGYAAGADADLDALEMRGGYADPSRNGRVVVAGHVEWTPRAPLGGDHVATPSSDPWFNTWRPSGGLGFAWRGRGNDRGNRLDASLNAQTKWRHLAAIAELILTADGGHRTRLSAAGEASALITDRALIFTRGELEFEYGTGVDTLSVGGGASWFVTPDRRNKLTFYGFIRRDTNRGPHRDGVIVQLQASL